MPTFNMLDATTGLYNVLMSNSDGYTAEVQSLVSVGEASYRKVVAVVDGAAFFFGEDGMGFGEATGYSLVLKRKPRTGWVNVWKNENPFETLHATTHTTLEQAIAERAKSCSGNNKTLLDRFSFEY